MKDELVAQDIREINGEIVNMGLNGGKTSCIITIKAPNDFQKEYRIAWVLLGRIISLETTYGSKLPWTDFE